MKIQVYKPKTHVSLLDKKAEPFLVDVSHKILIFDDEKVYAQNFNVTDEDVNYMFSELFTEPEYIKKQESLFEEVTI